MIQLLFALLPFALLAYLLLVREWSASKTLVTVYAVAAAVVWWVFSAPASVVLSASAKGVLLGLEVFLIILGVLLIFALLSRTGRIDALKEFFLRYHSDQRVHIVLIGWFFVAFLEGIAGFGTPAAIAAPLLVAIGVRPLTAVVVTLIADSGAVVFGAFGTPIIVGLQGALPTTDLATATALTAVSAGAFATIVPLIMLVVHAKLSGESLRAVRPYLPLALVSGLAFALPFVATALLFGPELPSVLAPVIGLAAVMLLLRLGVFGSPARIPSLRPVGGVLFPYALVVALLVISRANLLGFGDLLRAASIDLTFSHNITHTLSLYTPGALIIFAFILALIALRPKQADVHESLFQAGKKGVAVLSALLFAIMFAQLIVFSGAHGVPGIPEVIAASFAGTGTWYVLIAPLLGAFGSFVAGSATVSNLMLGSVQAQAAAASGLSEPLILALQALGSSAGNMIAIHNIVAVLAVVHLSRGTGKIIRVNAVVALLYCVFASLIVFLSLLL